MKQCKYLCLVGGLCSSQYVQKQFKFEFQSGSKTKHRLKVIIPNKPLLTVVVGAARMGLRNDYILREEKEEHSERISKLEVQTIQRGYEDALKEIHEANKRKVSTLERKNKSLMERISSLETTLEQQQIKNQEELKTLRR